MKATKFVIGAAAAALCMQTLIATADQTGQQAVDARQQHLKDLGGAFKVVRDPTRRPKPDMAEVVQAGEQINQLATDMPRWFPKDSAPSANIKTDAKAEIWSDPQGFDVVLKDFQKEAPKLLALAKANDVEGLKKQVGAVGGTCKGCHDKYRVPQN